MKDYKESVTVHAFSGVADIVMMAEKLSKEERTILVHDKDEPAYAYTLGNSVFGLPELIMFGEGTEELSWLLNTASDFQAEHPNIKDAGDFPFIEWQPPYKIKDIPRKNALPRVLWLRHFFHNDFKIRQLVMPIEGKYPWEKGYPRRFDALLPCLWKGR
jgi:hypothetical protein